MAHVRLGGVAGVNGGSKWLQIERNEAVMFYVELPRAPQVKHHSLSDRGDKGLDALQ